MLYGFTDFSPWHQIATRLAGRVKIAGFPQRTDDLISSPIKHTGFGCHRQIRFFRPLIGITPAGELLKSV